MNDSVPNECVVLSKTVPSMETSCDIGHVESTTVTATTTSVVPTVEGVSAEGDNDASNEDRVELAAHGVAAEAIDDAGGEADDAAEGDDIYQYHALRDFRVIRDDEGNDLDQVEVDWEGGVISWHDRSTLETEDNSGDLRMMAGWNEIHRTRMTWPKYRNICYGRGKYTAGKSKLCGFVAVKNAFQELGFQWVTDNLVADYIASGCKRNKD